ncbi:MAG: acyl-CoA carboxylase subunit beta [Acidimicrobiia bacterium]
MTPLSGPLAPVTFRTKAPGAATAQVHDLFGRRVVLVRAGADDDQRGALGSAASATVTDAAAHALRERLPLVVVVQTSGVDVAEGVSALDGWGRTARAFTACSGIVPIVMIVAGPAVSGPALLLGLADFVIMTEDAYAFVSGPLMIAQFTGEELTAAELGSAATHARHTGVAALIASDVEVALELTAALLDYLPDHADEEAPQRPTDDPIDRDTTAAGALVPDTPTGSYDVRKLIAEVVDDGDFLELHDRWATNVVTGFATIGGRPVGVLANQPISLAGTLDIPSSQKGARFVSTCDAFNLPIVTIVDTPGFYPGKDLEWRGMIRHGAQLVFAYGRAQVPRICLIVRKSYGGAYIVMDSKRMGNDVCLAWPTAEIAVMGAKQAAEILQRRATPQERAQFEADYESRLLNPYVAAERGFIDAVIDPRTTRHEIARALAGLASKRERLATRKHDNSPL